ncbi:DUF4190 domain-containing protein [Micromonospora sp. NPDC049679]|uniref:DUF4190 domain-containing protein n=1 Tax=Micromonospora sp. NPDC049679 TaxID=3155920 RepID=UPI00340980AD
MNNPSPGAGPDPYQPGGAPDPYPPQPSGGDPYQPQPPYGQPDPQQGYHQQPGYETPGYQPGGYPDPGYQPGGYPPPGYQPGGYQTGGTNVMAILSLVFAFVFSPAGIVLGHLAKKQIRQTGEQGDQLATWGLVLSYIFTGISVVVCCGAAALGVFGASTSGGGGY